MIIHYNGDVNIRLKEEDFVKLRNKKTLSQNIFGIHNKKEMRINVYLSNEKFYCQGGVGEGFDEESFQGFMLEPPKEQTQLAFPWGNEIFYRDYQTLNIKISMPALKKTLESGQKEFFGIARGIASGNLIDRLNLNFQLE